MPVTSVSEHRAVHQVAMPGARQARIELGFPGVWISPWSREDGITPLRGTLVLTAITEDQDIAERLVAESSIGNVYVGDHPTFRMDPAAPLDGYLAEFLMRTKTVIG